jgi:glycogen operon protein
MSGSADFYASNLRLPINSINFITCHDGFTLIDLFSYNHKHNEANGEGNRDGHNDNLSFNHGVEGPTDDPAIVAIRHQQARNAVALLLLSQGVPMLLSGDEVLRSQQGNNNGYCQDNELSWFDWNLVKKNGEMLDFVKQMIALRRRHPSLRRRRRFLTGRPARGQELPDISWHGRKLHRPPWEDPQARLLAFTLAGVAEGEAHLHVMINLSSEAVEMEVPLLMGVSWQRVVDTARPLPGGEASPLPGKIGRAYGVKPRSVVVLEALPQC